MQTEPIHGVIAKKSNNIPIKILIWDLYKSWLAFIVPILNIITGMLKNIIIKLPTVKFLSFNKFIELEITDIQVNIGELKKKIIMIVYILLLSIFNKIQAIGIIIKKGNWKNTNDYYCIKIRKGS